MKKTVVGYTRYSNKTIRSLKSIHIEQLLCSVDARRCPIRGKALAGDWCQNPRSAFEFGNGPCRKLRIEKTVKTQTKITEV